MCEDYGGNIPEEFFLEGSREEEIEKELQGCKLERGDKKQRETPGARLERGIPAG